MKIRWDDLNLIDEGVLTGSCYLDLRTGHFVEDGPDPTRHVPFLKGVRPRPDESDHWGSDVTAPSREAVVRMRSLARELSACRLFTRSLADRELASRLENVLDPVDATGALIQDEALALAIERKRPPRREGLRALVARVKEVRKVRRLEFVPKADWYQDDDAWVELRLSAFNWMLKRDSQDLYRDFHRASRIARLSDTWQWVGQLPKPPKNKPDWLAEVLAWRATHAAAVAESVAALLQRLDNWFEHNVPAALSPPNPGVSSASLDAFEQELGRPLPSAVRQILSWHDGRANLMPVNYSFSLMTLEEIRSRRSDELASGQERPGWWGSGWLPLLADPSGNLVVFDLDGDFTGVAGQLIIYWHDSEDRQVAFFDLESWLDALVTAFEKGTFCVKEDFIEESSDGAWKEHVREHLGHEYLEYEGG